ncbi:MAG: hypothetical protein AB7F19_04595 [Candidatus Babeliales bacterium]
MKKHLNKLVFSLCILFILNELIVTTVRPMALVIYEGAVLAISAAEALGVCELLLGAVILTENMQETHINHAAAEVACSYIAAQQQKEPFKEGIAITALGKEYAHYINPQTLPKQEIIQKPTAVATLAHVQNQISAQCTANTIDSHIAPKTLHHPLCTQPIEYKFDNTFYEPHTFAIQNGFRTTLGNGYFQMQFKPIATPKRKSKYEQEQEFINRYWINDPYFQEDLAQALSYCLDVLIKTNANDPSVHVEARLKCINLRLPGLYGAHLHNAINALLSYYFRADGSLEPYYANDEFEYIILNNFILPIFGTKNAHSILKEKKLFRAIARLEDPDYFARAVNWCAFAPINISYKIKENFYDRDPNEWKTIIRCNQTNRNLLELINACQKNDWHVAQEYRSCCPNYAADLYNYYYKKYLSATYNEYGIYREVTKDPRWAIISEQDRKSLKNNKEKQDALNTELLMRLDWKKRLQEAWQIPDDAHNAVHAALYQLVGITATPVLIDTIFKIISPQNKQREKLIDAFFEPCGILKDIAQYQNIELRANSSLLKPEFHVLCHQYNQLIYAYNIEKDTTQKSVLKEALSLICTSIKNNTCYRYQPSIQALYEAIITNQPTVIIKQEIERFYTRELACVVDTKIDEKAPAIETCPPREPEEIREPYGCKLPEIPTNESENWPCVQRPPEIAGETCGGVQGIEIEVIDSCNWSQGKPILQIEGQLEEKVEEDQDNDKNAIPSPDDEVIDEQGEVTPQHQYPTKVRPPKETDRCWDLPKHDPAIDIDKIDFSLTPYLTEAEIELIKHCIKLFLGVEGFLANDGALWRILKHEDQKKGSLFELEYIVELHDQNKTIVKMGYEMKIENKLVEIDIETDTELIECKAGTWEVERADVIEKLRKNYNGQKK